MPSLEKGFEQWKPGDNSADLSKGMFRKLADDLGLKLPEFPKPEDYQTLIDLLGKNKILRDNEEITALNIGEMAKYLEDSGVQDPMDRSVLDPAINTQSGEVDTYVMQAGVANWQDRMARVLLGRDPKGKKIITLAGNRVMNTGTEVTNDNVSGIEAVFSRYPSESEYMGSIVVSKLIVAGYSVLPMTFNSNDGDAMFEDLFEQNPKLLEERIAVVRTANAGLLMALQLRQAGRQIDSTYDDDPRNPQVFAVTDGFTIATTQDQADDAAHYQKPQMGLRQAVLTAKKLEEQFPSSQ